MANTAVVQTSLQYTPPAAPTNSGQPAFLVQTAYSAQQVGQTDIPSGTVPGSFDVSFGYIAVARVVIIKNQMTSDIDVHLNGSVAPVFTLPPQGVFQYEAPVSPSTGVHPLASASFTTLAAPVNTESVMTFVFGD